MCNSISFGGARQAQTETKMQYYVQQRVHTTNTIVLSIDVVKIRMKLASGISLNEDSEIEMTRGVRRVTRAFRIRACPRNPSSSAKIERPSVTSGTWAQSKTAAFKLSHDATRHDSEIHYRAIDVDPSRCAPLRRSVVNSSADCEFRHSRSHGVRGPDRAEMIEHAICK